MEVDNATDELFIREEVHSDTNEILGLDENIPARIITPVIGEGEDETDSG